MLQAQGITPSDAFAQAWAEPDKPSDVPAADPKDPFAIAWKDGTQVAGDGVSIQTHRALHDLESEDAQSQPDQARYKTDAPDRQANAERAVAGTTSLEQQLIKRGVPPEQARARARQAVVSQFEIFGY